MKRRVLHATAAVLCIAASAGFAIALLQALSGQAQPAADFTAYSISDTGSINVPTAILMDYRAFDTLGEASVIFTSVAVVLVILGKPTFNTRNNTLSILSRRAIGYLAPLFFLFPIYVITNGHLSPGGGFQGGVSLAVLVILLHVVYGHRFAVQRISVRMLGVAEYMSAIMFAAAGLVGIMQGAAFLSNVASGFPLGTPGNLVSAGIIPVLNLVVGCKVAAGLSTIYCALAGHQPDGDSA